MPNQSNTQNLKIWVRDLESVWVQMEILEVLSDTQVRLKNNDILKLDEILYCEDEDVLTYHDLTQLIHLHEPAILQSLFVRFQHDFIYTFTGPILLTVNPFKTIPNLYSTETLVKYLEANEADLKENVPHIFTVGRLAYQALCESNKSQTILISGESGAGKTESTRFLMRFLADAGSQKSTKEASFVEYQVLQSNPLLESFGNAKTLRNDNSSRFGKFIEMQFQEQNNIHKLIGARIQTYLLESVRVCHQLKMEGNYHIFYQLCAAAEHCNYETYSFPKINSKENDSSTFDLSFCKPLSYFNYLNQSHHDKSKDAEDNEMFKATVVALDAIGVSKTEQQLIFKLLFAILYIGNLDFETSDEGSVLKTECRKDLSFIEDLIEIEADVLTTCLTFRSFITKEETLKIPLKQSDAISNRDSLAKALYESLFLMLVQKANESIGYDEKVNTYCGILDIFGFECFLNNSFEQLCINYTNEKLQNLFNNFIFVCEDALYRREEIHTWNPLVFPDNQACLIALESKPYGIFAMLEEESLVPKGSDLNFCNKLRKQFTDGVVHFNKLEPKCFIINHFAAPVTYNADMFLIKNKDQLHEDAQTCILSSGSMFIRNLFLQFFKRGQYSNGKKKVVTISSEFQSQLKALTDTINETTPHFVRCIKPNQKNAPDLYERRFVADQLLYNGVLQSIELNRSGFPIRFSHREAFDRFKLLDRTIDPHQLDYKQNLTRLFNSIAKTLSLEPSSWALGKTILFLKQQTYNSLLSHCNFLKNSAALLIQKTFKMYIQLSKFKTIKRSVLKIQTLYRAYKARQLFKKLRLIKAVQTVNAVLLTSLYRSRYLHVQKQILIIQCAFRQHQARAMLTNLKRAKAALKIQTFWRSYSQKRLYHFKIKSIIRIQSIWRQHQAKQVFKKLKRQKNDNEFLLKEIEKLKQDLLIMKQKLEISESKHQQHHTETESVKTPEAGRDSQEASNSILETPSPCSQRKSLNNLELLSVEKDSSPKSHSYSKVRGAIKKCNQIKRKLSIFSMQPTNKSLISKHIAACASMDKSLDILIIGEPQSVQSIFEKELKFSKQILLEELKCSERPIAIYEYKKLHCMVGLYPLNTSSYNDLPMWAGNSKTLLFYFNKTISNKNLIEEILDCVNDHLCKVIYKNTSLMSNADKIFCKELEQIASFSTIIENKVPSIALSEALHLSEASRKHSISSTDESSAVESSRLSVMWNKLQSLIAVTKNDVDPSVLVAIQKKKSKKKGYQIRFLPETILSITTLSFSVNPQSTKDNVYLLAVGNAAGEVYLYCVSESVSFKHESKKERNSVAYNSGVSRSDSCNMTNSSKKVSETVSSVGSFQHMSDYKTSNASISLSEELNKLKSVKESLLYRISSDSQINCKITHIVFNSKNHYMIFVTQHKHINIWDLFKKKMLNSISYTADINCINFVPYDTTTYMYSSNDKQLHRARIYDLEVETLKLPQCSCNHFEFNATGTHCFLGLQDGSILVIKILKDSFQTSLTYKISQASITSIHYRDKTNPSLVVTTADKRLHIITCNYDKQTNAVVQLVSQQNQPIGCNLTPSRCCISRALNGTFIFAPLNSDICALSMLDEDTAFPIILKKNQQKNVVALSITKSSTLLATADAHGGLSLWRSHNS